MRRLVRWFKSHLNDWDEICVNENARLRTNNILTTFLITCISCFMLVFNLSTRQYQVIWFLALLAAVYLAMFLFQFHSARYQRWAAWVFGLMAFAMCLGLLRLKQLSELSYLWIFIVPHVAVMVVPLKDSLIYNSALLASLTAVLYIPPLHRFFTPDFSTTFRVLFPLALLSVMGCIYLAEIVRINTQRRLNATAQKLSSFAYTDPLTEAYNRHALASHFGEVKTAEADGLSFALMDLDLFKAVNDDYGHFVGDQMLQHVVQITRQQLPANALLYRWGGEEFLLVLKTRYPETVWQTLESIRLAVASTPLVTQEGIIPITLSIGAICARPGNVIHQCIATADECLYRAKHNGRNCVVASLRQGHPLRVSGAGPTAAAPAAVPES